jgi:transposase-like protein
VSQKWDLAATRRFFTRALEHGTCPTEVSTDRAPAYPPSGLPRYQVFDQRKSTSFPNRSHRNFGALPSVHAEVAVDH